MANMTTPSKHRTLLPKRPISKPSKYSTPLNPSARPADLQLKSTIIAIGSRQRPEDRSGSKQEGGKEARGDEDQGGQEDEDEMEVPVIEFDSSKAPQPFLDGDEALERMKALGRR